MPDPTFPLIPVTAFIGLLLTIAPIGYLSFRDHPGIVVFIFWQSMSCIQMMVNRTLWHGTVEDLAPLWCDITSRVEYGKGIGIPASLLCMMLGINRALRMEEHVNGEAKKRRMVWHCLAIAVLYPMVIISIYPVIAAYRYRYVIIEDVGCSGWIHLNWVTVMVYTIWPTVLSAITSVYCVLTLIRCWKVERRNTFADQYQINRLGLNRIMICAGVMLFTALPICVHHLVAILSYNVGTIPNDFFNHRKEVKVVHGSHVSPEWKAYYLQEYYVHAIQRLSPSFIFFLIFGTGDEAVCCYSRIFSRTVARLGQTRTAMQSALVMDGVNMLPSSWSNGMGPTDQKDATLVIEHEGENTNFQDLVTLSQD